MPAHSQIQFRVRRHLLAAKSPDATNAAIQLHIRRKGGRAAQEHLVIPVSRLYGAAERVQAFRLQMQIYMQVGVAATHSPLRSWLEFRGELASVRLPLEQIGEPQGARAARRRLE